MKIELQQSALPVLVVKRLEKRFVRRSLIQERFDALAGRRLRKTERVEMVARELGLSPKTIWRYLRPVVPPH